MALKDILFAGDMHGNLAHLDNAYTHAHRNGCTAIVAVGDFYLYSTPNDIKKATRIATNHAKRNNTDPIITHFVDGNHEAYWMLDPHGDAPVSYGDHMIYHPRGTAGTIAGVRMGFLGGAASTDAESDPLNNWAGRTPNVNWWPVDEVVGSRDLEKALVNFPLADIDVLVTHDSPDFALPALMNTEKSYRLDHTPSLTNSARVGEAARVAKPRYIVHGHYHALVHSTHDLNRDDGSLTMVLGLNCDRNPGATAVIADPTMGIMGVDFS